MVQCISCWIFTHFKLEHMHKHASVYVYLPWHRNCRILGTSCWVIPLEWRCMIGSHCHSYYRNKQIELLSIFTSISLKPVVSLWFLCLFVICCNLVYSVNSGRIKAFRAEVLSEGCCLVFSIFTSLVHDGMIGPNKAFSYWIKTKFKQNLLRVYATRCI